MSVSARIEALKTKHADLDVMVMMEEQRPSPDADQLKSLKRRKLQIKDEIARMNN